VIEKTKKKEKNGNKYNNFSLDFLALKEEINKIPICF